jgi:hypothetical protein
MRVEQAIRPKSLKYMLTVEGFKNASSICGKQVVTEQRYFQTRAYLKLTLYECGQELQLRINCIYDAYAWL